ncbi:MAG TPA: hypothetical protein VMR70_13490 [Flavisolibacter sp.]|nr:hypothetical protein [Flavisolibacter sp.]
MKGIIILIVILFTTPALYAQTWAEWMRQKKTQIKYLTEQIVALKVYGDRVQNGYEIAKAGLTTIGKICNGEWNLHNDFFGSLKQVNPLVKKQQKVLAIHSMQSQIVKVVGSILKWSKENRGATISEAGHIEKVCAFVLEESSHHLDELLLLLTSGELQMSDDERIQRLEKIYEQVVNEHAFIQAFAGSINRLLKGRAHEQKGLELSKILNGLK